MRNKTMFGAMAVSVALLLTACGGGGGGETETTAEETTASTEETTEATEETTEEAPAVRGSEDLVIWTDDNKLAAVTEAAKAFGEANGITVGVQAIVNTRSDFITANQAGNGPDVLVGAHDWIGQLVSNGAIDPLQLDTSGYAEKAVSAVTYAGQLYGVPYGVESLVLYCNTEIVGDTQWASIDDAIAAGQAAKDAGTVDSALNVPQGIQGDPYNMQPYYTSAGGYLFGKTADGSYNPDDLGVGTPAGVAAAAKIAELGEKGTGVFSTAITGDNAISLFAEGKAGCLSSGPWALKDVETGLAGKFNIQPIPGFAGMGPAQPFMGAQAFYVASAGKNKSFAQAFVTGNTPGALNTAETMTTLYEGANLPPAMTSVRDVAAAADPNIGIFGAAADAAEPMPAIPAMDQVWTPLGQAYAAVIGGADPASTMETTAATITAAIAGS